MSIPKSSSSMNLGPGGLDIAQAFFKPIHNTSPPSPTKRHTKISVIGAGNVGMAIAQTILTQVRIVLDTYFFLFEVTRDVHTRARGGTTVPPEIFQEKKKKNDGASLIFKNNIKFSPKIFVKSILEPI